MNSSEEKKALKIIDVQLTVNKVKGNSD